IPPSPPVAAPHPPPHSFPTRRSSDLGMFGLAIWDDPKRRLLLARDRAGEKPLFWTTAAGGSEIRFASEIQALLEYPDQARRVNRSEEHTSELQSRFDLVCRLLLEKKK